MKTLSTIFSAEEEKAFDRILDEVESAGAALASKRKVSEKACAHCGREFSGIKTARYCSASCRSMASRSAKKRRDRAKAVSSDSRRDDVSDSESEG